MDGEDKNSASYLLNAGLNAANTIKGAVQAGKTAANISKGTAAGGPYGAIAVGLWENRKVIGKIIAAIAFILLIPILYILMLPSIIFGDLGTDSFNTSVMNDNSIIMGNITEIENIIGGILNESHSKVLTSIEKEISELEDDIRTEIIDPYADDIFFNYDLIIAQYCVSKDKYDNINKNDLKKIIEHEKNNLFSYTSKTEIITEKDADGKDIKITKITYTVVYAGDSYYADNVFKLTDEQKTIAEEYAFNLNIFLNADYSNQSAAIHKSLTELADTYPYEWTDSIFNSPFADRDWQPYVTSEFGSRTDPITGVAGVFHSGIDIAFPKGTPIHAAKSGIVVIAEKKTTGYGYRVVINHGGGYASLYAHCSEILVKVGDTVSAGEVIAKVGTTGRSTGNHLHFEIIKENLAQDPRDYIG